MGAYEGEEEEHGDERIGEEEGRHQSKKSFRILDRPSRSVVQFGPTFGCLFCFIWFNFELALCSFKLDSNSVKF